MIIAFQGRKNAGVTTTAFKVAETLYEKSKKRVIYISLDQDVPTLQWLMGGQKADIPNLGDLFERDIVGKEGLLRNIYIERKRPNLGILAYSKTLAHQSPGSVSKQNIASFIKGIKDLAKYIIVDCGRLENAFEKSLWISAEKRILVVDANKKNEIAYQEGQREDERDLSEVWLIQKKENKEQLKRMRRLFIKEKVELIGFCRELQKQDEKGELIRALPLCKFRSNIEKAVSEIIA